MNAKLTLKLDRRAIESARRYARKNNQSLSSLVEQYFNLISGNEKSPGAEISPAVRELSGIIKVGQHFDSRSEYRKRLMEKYL